MNTNTQIETGLQTVVQTTVRYHTLYKVVEVDFAECPEAISNVSVSFEGVTPYVHYMRSKPLSAGYCWGAYSAVELIEDIRQGNEVEGVLFLMSVLAVAYKYYELPKPSESDTTDDDTLYPFRVVEYPNGYNKAPTTDQVLYLDNKYAYTFVAGNLGKVCNAEIGVKQVRIGKFVLHEGRKYTRMEGFLMKPKKKLSF